MVNLKPNNPYYISESSLEPDDLVNDPGFASAMGKKYLTPQSSRELMTANNSSAITLSSAGPYALLDSQLIPAFVEQPTGIVQLPNGNLAVAYRFVNPGSDNIGKGVIKLIVCTTVGQIVVPATVVGSDPISDSRGPVMTLLSDGRLLLMWVCNDVASGNPLGMTTGPDGVVGNIRYSLGAIVGDVITFSPQITVTTGYDIANGFDSIGYQPAIEIKQGVLTLTVNGSNTSKVWDAAETMSYVVGKFTPNGPIVWSTKSASCPAVITGHSTGENSMVVCANGDWLMTWRDSPGQQAYSSRCLAADAPTAAGNWVDGKAWSAGTVLANVGTLTFAQPTLTKLPSGTLVFPSRGVVKGAPNILLCSSTDNGLTWLMQDVDASYPYITNYYYSGIIPLNTNAGVFVIAIGASMGTTSTIRLRYGSEGVAIAPSGTLMGSSLVAPQATVGAVAFSTASDVGVLTFGFITKGTRSPTHVFVGGHPLPEYLTLQTNIAVSLQNMPRDEVVDSMTSPLVSGTMYLIRTRLDTYSVFRYLILYTGSLAAAGITHCWASWFKSWSGGPSQTNAMSADIVATPGTFSPIKFDFGVTTQMFVPPSDPPPDVYIGIVMVGATLPSLLGKPATPVATIIKPPLLGNATGTGTGLTTPLNINTPGVPAVGGAFKPWLQFSTT